MTVVEKGASGTAGAAPDAPAPAGAPGRSRKLRLQLARVVLVLVLLGLWQLANHRLFASYVISSPYAVGRELVTLFTGGGGWAAVRLTGLEFVLGYLLGVAAGALVGILLGFWEFGAALLEPIISVLNGIPHIALAPLFLIWFGIGISSKVFIAAMIVFFIMYFNVYMAVRHMPRELMNVVRVMGGRRWFVARRVVVPQISVPLVAGLKASVPFAMIGVIVGEFIAANQGVGYLIRQATENFDTPTVYAGIVVLLAMILFGRSLVAGLERLLLGWKFK